MPSNYQPGVPTGRVNLDTDYQNLQKNFQQLDTTFGVNHTTFSNTSVQNGYHTNCQFIPQTPPVNAITGFGQLYTETINDGFSSDQALIYQSGGGLITLLTRNFAPVVNTNGATFLPGGLMFQWGSVAPTNSNVITVTFPEPFKNAVFSVLLTRNHNSVSPGSDFQFWVNSSPAPTLSQFQIINEDMHTWGYYWQAIGH